jgi:ribonuclease D
VRSALTKAGVFKDLKTDVKSNSATFKVSADLNFKKKLDEIVADGNKHVKGYKIEKKKKDVKKKTVSLKLPNMT